MKAIVARFEDADAIVAGAAQIRADGYPLLDALTPFPMEKLNELLGATVSPRLRGPMATAGFGVAALFFAFETWSAVWAYPFNEGGRPLFSWQVFLLSPFEIGILVAGIAGFGVFLFRCGLPRLNHPYFEVPGIERATQDRFFLVVDPVTPDRLTALRSLLLDAGATLLSETDT